tara:strand:+ start:140513 stop:141199 length:687 start_codon:yes stop_codon:yes gene_type:complete
VNQFATRKIRLIMKLRSEGIQDTAVLSAIEKIPREAFVPGSMRDQAYEDKTLPIGLEQTISQPFVVATMTQALELDYNHKVLEVGTGSGYQAAVLSLLCRRVYSIERHRPLLEAAEQRFEQLKLRNITAICADGMKGWQEQAPFDRIIVTACAQIAPPDALLNQLKEGGIMIIPVAFADGSQKLMRYKKEGEDTFAVRDIVPVRFVPLLPNVVARNAYQPQELQEVAF